MLPSRRVYWLLSLGLVIPPLLGILERSPYPLAIACLSTLLFDGVIIALMVWDGQWVRRDRVTVTRAPLARLSIGRDNPVVLSVQTGQSRAMVQIRDEYPPGMSVSEPMLRATLDAKTGTELRYTARPSQRGEFRWGNIQVRQLGPWGLAWSQWSVPQWQSVAVYPDLLGLRELSIKLALQSTGAMRQSKRMGMGTEFTELRDYALGDDLRFIDWKATARRSRPLIRVLEPEQEQTLLILLDRGRLMTAQVNGLKRFDWGLNATLSLAMAGIQRGDRVGVAVFDRQIHTWIPPERGQVHLSKLLERLTPIQPELVEPDYFGTVSTLINQQTRRALVVMITDIVDSTASAELLAALGRLTPRYLPFCVTLRDPVVDHLAQRVTEDISSTYTRAVALDLIAQRQAAFAKLKQKGALVLDAPANQISEQLVDRYLRLKARSQL